MKTQEELDKATVYRFADVLDFATGSRDMQSILRKTTGELNAVTMDTNQFLDVRLLPFDIYIHVIEGKVETVINGGSLFVNAGEFLIIPGHTQHTSQALQPTRLLQLTIKSGYEDVV